ncbi:MAG TPA: hypothetical protein DCR93_09690 [Cytophagales bacterium]|nr:hypothetical protein [Cytophagales bacterium]HAP59753.1 hypothetical protein [Cytophagales bacterium]
MDLSTQAQNLYEQVSTEGAKLGELRKLAKEIKRDHDLALELWTTGHYHARMLAILIMDKKQLTQQVIDKLDEGLRQHEEAERNQLTDWLMANQITKDKKALALLNGWQHHASPTLRRMYWYYQGRLRWMGNTPPDNTAALMEAIEKELTQEVPEVQWAMNFTACWIGVFETDFRARCIELGEKTGLYQGLPVAKNCTPEYLPEFIEIEAGKRGI